jgi:thiol-disulfide isomerase/thioredoxin
MKLSANDIVLKVLGLLQVAAAVMKGYELLTVPVANADIWSNRYFLIFTVEFELALGIWLLSGLFKRAAWLAAMGCFVLFSGVTLYKALTGAASCGCFGTVQVNPWITLLAIDLPAVVFLSIFRPNIEAHRVFSPLHWLQPRPNPVAFGLVFVAGLTAVAASAPILIRNEPLKVTSRYEILEPSEWVGKELPILDNIDIADQLREGNWLIMLYHHGCPGCAEAIPKIEQMARELQGNEDFLRFAFIEVPPYAQGNFNKVSPNTPVQLGKLDTGKEWFITTPAISMIQNGNVLQSWQDNVPVLAKLYKYACSSENQCSDLQPFFIEVIKEVIEWKNNLSS